MEKWKYQTLHFNFAVGDMELRADMLTSICSKLEMLDSMGITYFFYFRPSKHLLRFSNFQIPKHYLMSEG